MIPVLPKTLVTGALGNAELTHAVPFDVSTFPDVPGDVNPVPPCPTAAVPEIKLNE